MPYALNTVKGTVIQNADIGDLPGLTAIPITDKQTLIAKHLINVVVFEKIAGVNPDKATKGYYGITREVIERSFEEAKTYKDFMIKYKDPKIAGVKWNEYKQKFGINEGVTNGKSDL